MVSDLLESDSSSVIRDSGKPSNSPPVIPDSENPCNSQKSDVLEGT